MNEDEIRWLVLGKLHDGYLKDSRTYVMKGNLLEAQGILGLPENVLDRTVKYLEQKGLIDVIYYIGGGFMARLNAYGVDAIERREREVLPKAIAPTAVLEEELDKLVADRMPSLGDDLTIARTQLAEGNKAIDFQAVALNCRNLFLAFADEVYEPEFLPEGETEPRPNETKRKLKLTLRAVDAGKTERDLVEAIIDEFDALVVFIQKHVHDPATGRANAAACLAGLETAMLIVLRAISQHDERK